MIPCGVEVSATTLDAPIAPDGRGRFAHAPEGVGELVALGREPKVNRVAMEATGGYARLPFALLWAAGIPAALVNPRQVRRLAEAMGLLEKTDRIDAAVIARFAAVTRLAVQPPASATQQRLAALATRLGQLTRLRVAQANQRRLVAEPDVRAAIDALLAFLSRQERALEARIAALIEGDPLRPAPDTAFRQVKGVADRTVARLLAERPEIGTRSTKAVAKRAGLAPLARDSGTRSGRRSVRGGRAGVRAILVVVAGVVGRHEPDFAAFRTKLLAAGKPRLVGRVALARTLLVRLNAKARDARRELARAA